MFPNAFTQQEFLFKFVNVLLLFRDMKTIHRQLSKGWYIY